MILNIYIGSIIICSAILWLETFSINERLSKLPNYEIYKNSIKSGFFTKLFRIIEVELVMSIPIINIIICISALCVEDKTYKEKEKEINNYK